MMPRIYCDHAATTPLRPEALEAMRPFLHDAFGNPSSLHANGQRAKRALDTAREQVSGALGCAFERVTFTGGGTEANNAAILGVLWAAKRGRFVTSLAEHEAVLNCARFAEAQGFAVTYLMPDEYGRVSPSQVADALRPDTVLASVMHASNEVGTISDVRGIADVCASRGVLLHTDAVQTLGQLDTDVQVLGADLLTISAHKVGGPQGVGALYVRGGVSIEPFLHGGRQERERRAGTENVAGIAGFGAAAACARLERDEYAARVGSVRDLFVDCVRRELPGTIVNGDPLHRLPNNANISLPGLDAEALLIGLDGAGVSASSGSACTSGSVEPSHVLTAMGLDAGRVRSALRFTWGRGSTMDEAREAAVRLATVARRMAR